MGGGEQERGGKSEKKQNLGLGGPKGMNKEDGRGPRSRPGHQLPGLPTTLI